MHDWRRALGEALAGLAAEVRLDEPMARHTSFRIGGPADVFVLVNDRKALEAVLAFCRKNEVEFRVLGRGSNVLISDQGLRGVVVTLAGELASVQAEDGRSQKSEVGSQAAEVRAGAGATLDELVAAAEKAGLVGIESLAGIPGTVGGGLRTNAGAFGRSLGDVVKRVVALDRSGTEVEVAGESLGRGYRQPVVDPRLTVVTVYIELERGTPRPAAEIRGQRWAKHPKEPSAGSFFKNPKAESGRAVEWSSGQAPNPERIPAGRLVEQCGLQGRSVGGARVSEKHANFIVNTGRARFADVLELAQVVKATVEQEAGILLEEEVQYLPGRGRRQE
jgi:UDP-N-acetylmuramate dehydrogenase